MSTTDPLVDTKFAKRFVIVNCLVPGALLVWDAFKHQLGVNDVNFAIRTTGMIGIVLITLALLVTPLRALTGWQRLISVRRNLGVIAFCYLATHFLIFFLLDRQASVSSTLSEIVTRKYLWFGTAALTLMIPMAITSTDGWVTRLGAKNWKRLQRLAYLVAIGAVVHYYMLVKSDVRLPLAFIAAVTVLFVYRMVAHYFGLRAEVREARMKKTVKPASATKKFWSGELAIARVFDETQDVKTFRLVSTDGGPLPFAHVAGQYLNLALTIDGKRVNRSYTIASSPTRAAYCEISVKRAENGFGSKHVHETWREGQRVKVSAPAGKFVFAGPESNRIVLIAGGIGITPMMSVVRSLTDRGWAGEIYLLYSIKFVSDFAFRDELAYLASRFSNLHVQAIVSRDPDTPWDGPRGQITREVIASFVPNLKGATIMLCGPAPMMTAMRATLVGMGVPNDDVHQEEFVSRPVVEDDGSMAAMGVPADELPSEGVTAKIAFKRAGHIADIASDQSILEAAEAVGIDLPFECRSGICGQCKTRLVSGRVQMAVQDALTAADRAKGFILACQAHALRDIEVDA